MTVMWFIGNGRITIFDKQENHPRAFTAGKNHTSYREVLQECTNTPGSADGVSRIVQRREDKWLTMKAGHFAHFHCKS